MKSIQFEDGLSRAQELIAQHLIPIGLRLTGALVLWLVGRWVIGLVKGGLSKAMALNRVDATLVRYLESAASAVLTMLLLVAILSVFGVETTSFAGLLAAAGVAIGMAWSGLLSNFAAGVFLLVLKPFKVGDAVSVGGVTGAVMQIGMFNTAIDTADNVRVYVGNTKIFGDNIQNFSTNAYRRADIRVQLPHGVDAFAVGDRLKEAMAKVPGVLAEPSVIVDLVEHNAMGALLSVKPACRADDFARATQETHRAVAQAMTESKFPVPSKHLIVHQAA